MRHHSHHVIYVIDEAAMPGSGAAVESNSAAVAAATTTASSRSITRPGSPRPLPPIPTSVRNTETEIEPETLEFRYIPGWFNDPYNMSANNNAFPPLDTSFNNRASSSAGSQPNGAGMNANNNNMPNYVAAVPVGHQQDLMHLFQQFQALQAQLANNREKVNDITRSAEEVARRANGSTNGAGEEYDHEADRAKVRELDHTVARLQRLVDLYKHEQRENTGLIAQYEDALGTATEQIRTYCNEIDTKFLSQRRHYNNLLQAEKDEHLQSRLSRDHWHNMTLELCGMLNRANRLRNDEWADEYRVVVGLQTEVRCFRRVLGFEPEKLEEETGWPVLKDAPFNDQA